MPIQKFRSIEEMPRPMRAADDPENLRETARMMSLYGRLAGKARPGVRRFRTIEEANADRDDPYRR
jgi:hypothetical protein